MTVLATVLIGLSGTVGALAGLFINYFLTERSKAREWSNTLTLKQIDVASAERSRLLDLYKIVYPEKRTAAIDIMSRAGFLHVAVRGHSLINRDPQRAADLGEKLVELLSLATGHQVLLGPDVLAAVQEFRMACINAFLQPREVKTVMQLEDGSWAHDASYQAIICTLRRTLHLDELDELVLKQ